MYLLVGLLRYAEYLEGYSGSKQEYYLFDLTTFLLDFLVPSLQKSTDVAALNQPSDYSCTTEHQYEDNGIKYREYRA